MSQSKIVVSGALAYRRLFTDKDLVGFFQLTRTVQEALQHIFASKDIKDDVIFVSLGRSPAVITEFMRQEYGFEVVDLPLGGMSEGVSKKGLNDRLGLFIAQALPPKRVVGRKAVVVVDFAYSGTSIHTVRELLEEYVAKCCQPDRPPAVFIVPISWKRDLLDDRYSLLNKFDPETRAAHRLLKTLFLEVDKPTYSRHRSIKYEDVLGSEKGLIISDYELAQERRSLEKAMTLSLAFVKQEGYMLEYSGYLFQRKHKKNAFSRSQFLPGYRPAAEEAWRYNLLAKSAAFYRTTVRPDVTMAHYGKYARLRTSELWWGASMRTRRIVAFALLLLFVWVVYRMFVWAFRRR